jgi:hypothetical protein
MSNREELAKVIYNAGAYCGECIYDGWDNCADCRNCCRSYADGALAAGWRPPARVITTVRELDALPVGSIVRGDKFGVAIKEDSVSARPWATDGFKFAESSVDVLHRLGKPELIYEP